MAQLFKQEESIKKILSSFGDLSFYAVPREKESILKQNNFMLLYWFNFEGA